MLAPASRADSGDFRVGGAAAGASVCVSVFFEKPNEVAWRPRGGAPPRARPYAEPLYGGWCGCVRPCLGVIKNLGHFEAICITSRRSQKMMWLSGVGASALLRVPTTRAPANAVGHTLAGIELRAAPAAA